MSGVWVTTLTYDGEVDEEVLVQWAEEFEPHDGSVAALPGRGFTVTIWLDGGDLLKAAITARDLADSLVSGNLVTVETATAEEYERRADAPTLPEMLSAPEVGEMLGGISRQRVYQLHDNPDFPQPLLRLRTGPIWDARAVEKFRATWARKAGRPRRTAS